MTAETAELPGTREAPPSTHQNSGTLHIHLPLIYRQRQQGRAGNKTPLLRVLGRLGMASHCHPGQRREPPAQGLQLVSVLP